MLHAIVVVLVSVLAAVGLGALLFLGLRLYWRAKETLRG